MKSQEQLTRTRELINNYAQVMNDRAARLMALGQKWTLEEDQKRVALNAMALALMWMDDAGGQALDRLMQGERVVLGPNGLPDIGICDEGKPAIKIATG